MNHPARALLALALAVGPWIVARAADMPLRVVPDVDYARYAGTWYEIARLPNWFEENCASDITAEYTLRPDGRLAVVNRCRKANGATREATGVARRVEGQPPSVLKVRFAPGFLTWLPQVWGDYQMIALAPDYSTVVVGSPNRKYLWILARAPRLDDAVYQRLVDEARSQAFDVGRILKVQQAAR